MRNDGGKIEFKFDGVVGVGVSAQFASIFPPVVDVDLSVTGTAFGPAFSRPIRIAELETRERK